MLNSTVPANCTSAAHRPRPGAVATSRYTRKAAAVKKSDPTKKVTPSVLTPTALT